MSEDEFQVSPIKLLPTNWTDDELNKIVQDKSKLAFAYLSMNPLYRRFYRRMKQACSIAGIERPGEFLGWRPLLYYFYEKTLKSYALEDFVNPDTSPSHISPDIWYRYLAWKSKVRNRIGIIPSPPDQGKSLKDWKDTGVWPDEYVYMKIPIVANRQDLINDFESLLKDLGMPKKNTPTPSAHKKRLLVYRKSIELKNTIGLIIDQNGKFNFEKAEKRWCAELCGYIEKDRNMPRLVKPTRDQNNDNYKSTIRGILLEAENYVFGGYKNIMINNHE